MAIKKGLGRGFESLIPSDMLIDDQFDTTLGVDSEVSKLVEIPLSKIFADPNQPRRHFDEEALADLTNSVKIHGVLQPIVVIKKDDDTFEIVAGERRYRASKMAGLESIPAIVRDISGQTRLELSLIENLQRSDLNVLETAAAYLKLREQFNMTAKQIGERVGGRSESAVLNTLRLLNLPDEVKKYIYSGDLKESQARPLLKIDEATVLEILPRIIEEGWSVRKIEQFLVGYKKAAEDGKKSQKGDKISATPFESTTRAISERLGADVDIRASARGSGKIVIKFKSEDELNRLSDILSK